MNYYNENDPAIADWLDTLIREGVVPPGHIDRRSIQDVVSKDVKDYTQCHFFAGIGGWSIALGQAGFPLDRPVWTASCPCQPFSQAGSRRGLSDERHLWPELFRLIRIICPECILGEQVATKGGYQWLDTVQDDLEAAGYPVGAITFPACSVGASEIRQRLYWVADARFSGLEGQRWDGHDGDEPRRLDPFPSRPVAASGDAGRVEHSARNRCHGEPVQLRAQAGEDPEASGPGYAGGVGEGDTHVQGNPTDGFWADPDWLYHRDGRWRPVERGTFPLANGHPEGCVVSRRVALHGIGNSIVIPQAKFFIEMIMEAM